MAKFQLGQVVATPGALGALQETHESPWSYIDRHSQGDWGDVSPEDKQANDQALVEGTRILSAYTIQSGNKIWIITEADRTSTCILLPEEY